MYVYISWNNACGVDVHEVIHQFDLHRMLRLNMFDVNRVIIMEQIPLLLLELPHLDADCFYY
jgi:hypothetical protein